MLSELVNKEEYLHYVNIIKNLFKVIKDGKFDDIRDKFIKMYKKELSLISEAESDAQKTINILQQQRTLNNKNTIDRLRRIGVTNECFKDQAQRIMELRSMQGTLDMKTRKTLEKFIMKYTNNANIAFNEMQSVGKSDLDKKIEGCIKAYTVARNTVLIARNNNFEKHNEIANSIRKNLIDLFQLKYPDMPKDSVMKLVSGIN